MPASQLFSKWRVVLLLAASKQAKRHTKVDRIIKIKNDKNNIRVINRLRKKIERKHFVALLLLYVMCNQTKVKKNKIN